MGLVISDVFKKNFVLKAKVKNNVVRGTITDKHYNQDRSVWDCTVSSVIDGKTYSKVFPITEIIDATDNNGILRID